MISYQKRKAWLVQAFQELRPNDTVDVLNRDFVESYICATEVEFIPTNYGAPKCYQLGADLSKMYNEGILLRTRTGIQGFAGMGFPTWVWSYSLNWACEEAR